MKSLDELDKLKKSMQEVLKVREGSSVTKIVVGMGTCGIAAGAREVLNAIIEELKKKNVSDVIVTQTGCLGLCQQEPLVEVIKEGEPKITYTNVDRNKVSLIVEESLAKKY